MYNNCLAIIDNMIITALIQGKKENFVNVYLDDEFAASITKNTLAEFSLFKDKFLDNDTWSQIIDHDLIIRLFLRAIGYLETRPRSQGEIEIYLEKKAERLIADPIQRSKTISKAVNKLLEQNLLNDNNFASWWVENRINFRARSSAELSRELQQKFISREIINDVLSKNLNDTDQTTVIRENAKKKLHVENLDFLKQDKKTYTKIVQYFLRRGFAYNLVKQALLEEE